METTEFLHNHSQAHSLDISNIISKNFGSLFMTDRVDPEIIENLKVSQGSTDSNHVKYVTELMKITNDRQETFEQTKRLKEHILWTRDEALKEDEKLKEENKEYEYLNLPPEESKFFTLINNDLLRENGLIAPDDIFMNLREVKSESFLRKHSFSDLDVDVQNTNRKNNRLLSSSKKEYRLPPIEKSSTNEQSKKRKSDKKRNPVDMILATEKDENRIGLEMMAAKNNFLKNPRHLIPEYSNDSKSWLIQTNKESNSQKMFLPIPEIVEFSDYEVGKIYQRFINFRNITTVLRSIRVLPPKTKYFSLGLGQFPGEHGLVAAGISCQYAIRFSPDSLGDFDDEIIVETQGNINFPVKIIAKRPRPIITGSNEWKMNYCLVYGLKVLHYKIKNVGGTGKFCIAESNFSSVSNSKAIIHSSQFILEPFVIRPSQFELRTNESINLEMIFCPNSLGLVEREFVIICDNCHAESFKITGHGEMAMVSVENVEGGESVPELDESIDISAQMLLRFNSLHPFTYCQKTVALRNESHTEIPFCWKIVKPNLKPPSADVDNLDLNILKNRTLDFDSAFVIEPAVGIFPPNEILQFTITFAPLEVKLHHSVFHLVLQGIADFKPDLTNSSMSCNEGINKQKTLSKMTDEGLIESHSSSLSPNIFKMGGVVLNDVTSLEIEVKGTSIPLNVRFNTPSIILPGQLLINTPVRKQLQIINESMCPVSLIWDKPKSEDYIFEVEPKLGMIDTKEIGVVDVCIVANKPGFFRDTLICHVECLDNPLELIVEANFKGPELEIDNADLDFGLVKVNDTVRKSLTLYNKSSINCSWRSRIGGTSDITLLDEINIHPKGGILGPLQSQKVLVTFSPKESKFVNCGIEIGLENGSTKCLNVLACVQSPRVVLNSATLNVTGILFVNTSSVFVVTLCNESHLASHFNWNSPVGKDANFISIFMDRNSGVIEPKGKIDVKLTITYQLQMEITDIILPCVVEGMDEPIGLSISGSVLGPKLTYSVFENIDSAINESDEIKSQTLNFGNEVPIFQNMKRYILIENGTSITTNYEITIDYFKTSLENNDAEKSIKKRPNLADRQSKPEKLANFDFSKSMLAFKHGIAVGFNPLRGILQSFEKVLIEVTAYNDMWGEYHDFVRISGYTQNASTDQLTVPFYIGVVGTPLEFTMTAGRKEQKPILRLGSKPFGEEPISRKIRINNKSCCNIYINWEMYNSIAESDEKIIDVILNFADPFPIIKENNESNFNYETYRTFEINNTTESNASNSTRMLTDRKLDCVNMSERYIESFSSRDISDDLISIVIRPHDGLISNKPVSFEPEQLLIPSESHGFVTVTFNPQFLQNEKDLCLDENGGVTYNNFLLGFLSLEQNNLLLDSRLLRLHQYQIEQIRLDITGRILLPNLQVDFPDTDEREEIFFSIPFSSLLVKNEYEYCLLKTKAFTSYATLRNLKDVEIKYSLKTRSPFEIANGKNKDENEIKIGETIKVNLKFILDKGHLSLLKDENLYNHNDSHCLKIENQLLPNETNKTAKMIQFRDVISVVYKNTKIDQLIPIRAQIFFPEFLVSKSAIDFQTCFVKETTTDYIRIINKSKSASYIVLKLVNSSDSVFELNKYFGLIKSTEINSDENQLEVQISFTPKQAVNYSATLIVSGIMGEEECSIPIKATGSYDNKYQKKY